MRIAANFSDAELVVTTHKDLAIKPQAIPYPALVMALRLVHGFLQPVRSHYGLPVIVRNLYRHPALNRRVKGKDDSPHLGITQRWGYAAAADFHVRGIDAHEVFRDIAQGKLLCEFNRLCLYVHENRLHVDVTETEAAKLFYVNDGDGWEPVTREDAGEM